MTPVRTLVFAKAPRPGHAKTRLIPALGAAGAADLAVEMLRSTLRAALEAGLGPVELCADPGISDPAWSGIAIPAGVERSEQGSGDLGARMARAAARTTARGEAALLVGTDCAEMGAALLQGAAALLRLSGTVLHPTADGGYALLGLTRFDPSIFRDIAWGTASVAETTIDRIRALGWPLAIGDTLHDIDEPADLIHRPPAR